MTTVECPDCDGATLEEPGCDECNRKLWEANGFCIHCGADYPMVSETRCHDCSESIAEDRATNGGDGWDD